MSKPLILLAEFVSKEEYPAFGREIQVACDEGITSISALRNLSGRFPRLELALARSDLCSAGLQYDTQAGIDYLSILRRERFVIPEYETESKFRGELDKNKLVVVNNKTLRTKKVPKKERKARTYNPKPVIELKQKQETDLPLEKEKVQLTERRRVKMNLEAIPASEIVRYLDLGIKHIVHRAILNLGLESVGDLSRTKYAKLREYVSDYAINEINRVIEREFWVK